MDLCERSTQRVGVRVSRRWWDQEGIDLKEYKEWAAEALATDSESESEVKSEAEVETEPEVGRAERSASSGVSRSVISLSCPPPPASCHLPPSSPAPGT